ncbi:J protein JJJ2-like [Musa acuminata AAA Group]|uniref:J protein JJJ2-like n=1 Tax=Musa acuminata AAA Group TaxID=214697 RepID=UPI0031E363C5
MECNKDEAVRAKEIAERKFSERDLEGARKFAMKAQNLFPALEGIGQMIATLDVHVASEEKVYGEKDWYAILSVSASADEDTVKKQYRKLALQLHPDKNKSVGAEGAFQLISEAWSVLSDKSRRTLYDQKRCIKVFSQKTSRPNKNNNFSSNVNGFHKSANSAASKVHSVKNSTNVTPAVAHSSPEPPIPETFWTSCNKCKMQYEYLRVYLNHNLLCPNCHEPFLAKETKSSANGFSSSGPWSASQQCQPSSNRNSTRKNAPGLGRSNSTLPGMGSSGIQNGANLGSLNNQNFQWGPFSRTAGVASATASSAAAAQAANVVHQTYEKVRKEREEAQAAARREEALHRKNSNLKRNASACGIINVGSNDTLPAKRARGVGKDAASDSAAASAEQFGAFETNRTSGVNGDFCKFRTGVRHNNLGREFSHIDIRSMLIEMTKLAIHKKLEDWKSAATEKIDAKENVKKKQKLSETDTEEVNNVVHRNATNQDRVVESMSDTEQFATEKNSSNVQSSDSDNECNEPVSIVVPDPDFHDFDIDRSERSFESDQIWATYDDEDGMPRYYALVQQVISLKPFKVRMSFLTSRSNSEFGPLNWVASGFPKTCGDFRIGRYEVNDTINIFSHKVRWEKGPRGVIKIVPRKGETWALYRNWSPEWNEHTADDIIYKYDMVEVLEDYSEEQGVSVIPLVKVSGFRTIFCRHLDPMKLKRIPKEEMFRFSHQVPSYLLTGEEAENAPKGFFELDPAATPLELLQINENKSEVAAEAVEQAVK